MKMEELHWIAVSVSFSTIQGIGNRFQKYQEHIF